MTYEIFEGNMKRLEKKLTSIYNKCKAYGCAFHYEVVGETFKPVKSDTAGEQIARFLLVEAEGMAIINNWEFVASVEHTENGNIFTGTGHVQIPERYYKNPPVCEHCNSDRYRKYTYIVRNKETGEFKQVGKTCLKDFTCGMNAEAVTHYLSLFDTLIEGNSPEPGCFVDEYFSVQKYLSYVAETIRRFGYVKTGDEGRPTAYRAMDYYRAANGCAHNREGLLDEMERSNFDPESETSTDTVEKALAWIKKQAVINNYIHNLQTVCGLEYTTRKNLGLLASLIPAYERDRKRKERNIADTGSEYAGTVGDKISFVAELVRCVASYESDYGTTHVYKFIDMDGNVFIWNTQKTIDGEKGLLVTGTVKGHEIFRGIKQTKITRCRITDPSKETEVK